MDIQIVTESVSVLSDYARIPISFEVRSILEVDVVDGGLGGIRLSERRVDSPWVKDYDGYEGEGPMRWTGQWDISNWVVLSAYYENNRVGGLVIAFDTPGVHMLEDRNDIAAVWDLRIKPEDRGRGIGGRLIEAAVEWAKNHMCRLLKIETQNINVPACHLYAKHGFSLGVVNRYAYPNLPSEVQLIWYREL